VTSSRADLSSIAACIAAVRDAAAAAGREPDAIRIICRGMPAAPLTGADGHRLVSDSLEQIREDSAWLAGQGVTEIFYDFNWDPLIGGPDAPPDAAADRAASLIEALAPAG
jgi:hypothetical protein